MAGARVSGNRELNYSARLDITQLKKNAEEAKRIMAEIAASGKGASKAAADIEKSTAQGVADAQSRIKLQTLEANKAKADSLALAAKEKAAQAEIATQIKLNTLARQEEIAAQRAQVALDKERAAQAAARPATIVSNSQSEIDAYNASTLGVQTGPLAAVKSLEVLKAELLAVQEAIAQLNAYNEAGTVSSEVFASGVAVLTENELRLKAAIDGYNISAVEQIETTRASSAAIETEIGLLESLKIVLADLKAQKLAIVDPLTVEADRVALTRINAQIQETEAEMSRLNNIGKVGFDAQGVAIRNAAGAVDPFNRAITRATSISAIGARVITSLTRQIVGLGVGLLSFAIGSKAIEYIVDWVKNLDMFSGRLDQVKHNMEAFNEVQKASVESSAKELTSLKLLYEAATDVTNSMEKRVEAAQKIKAEYPASFANSTTQAILNGKEKDSYDQLTKSLLDAAAAQAALDKISKLYATVQEQEYQKQKIRIGTQTENNRIKAAGSSSIIGGGTGISGASTSQQLDSKALIAANNKAAADQIKEIEQNQQVALRTIDFLKTYSGGAKKIAETLTGVNKLIADPLKNFDAIIKNASDEEDLVNLKKSLEAKLKALAPDDKQMADYQAKIKQVDKVLKQYNPKANDGVAQQNAYNEALKRRADLITSIGNAIKNTNAKQLSEDQSQLTVLSDTFDQLRQQVATFNADPKNIKAKIHIGKDYVDKNGNNRNTFTDTLDAPEQKQIDNQANINENKFIAEDIEKKKKLYDDYEAYKLKVGSKAADADYQNLLLSGKNFTEYLNNINSSIDKFDLSGPMQERREMIKKALDGQSEDQRKSFQELLAQSVTYDTQRRQIAQAGADAEKKLRNKGFSDEANQISKNTQDALDALAVANFKSLAAYQTLFENIDVMSTASAKKQISNLYAVAAIQYALGKTSAKSFLDIVRLLDGASKAINEKVPQGIKNIGSAVSGLGSQIGDFDEGFGKVLKTAGSLLTNLGEIKSTINTLNSSSSSTFDKVSAGFGFIGAIWSATAALEEYFLQSDQKYQDAVYKNQKEIDAIDAVNKALERQIALTKQLYGGDLIKGYLSDLNSLTTAQEKNQKNLEGKLALTGDHTLDLEIGFHNAGSPLFDLQINKLVQLGKVTELSKLSIEELNQLLDKKLLDDKSAAIVQSMIDLDQQIKDTQNALNESLTGTSFDSLLDSIVSLFQNATTSAEDFGKNFQKIIQDSLLNSFKRDYLGKQLQGFYDNLADLTQEHGTLSKDDIARLQDQYNTILANANQQFINLQNATGITFDPNADSSSARKQVSAALTEDTATRSYGVWAGTQTGVLQVRDGVYQVRSGVLQVSSDIKQLSDSFAQSFLLARDHFNVTVQIEANTRRGADNTDGLIPALKEIIKNTNGAGSSMRGAGLG